MSIRPTTDIGGHVSHAYAGASSTTGAPVLIVAAAATDNVKRTGATVDRATHNMPESAVLTIAGLFTLGDAATCKFAAEILESDDGSNWGSAVALFALADGLAGTGPGGGGNVTCLKTLDMVLKGRKRYFRVDITCDLSAGSADTGHYTAQYVFGGGSPLPV